MERDLGSHLGELGIGHVEIRRFVHIRDRFDRTGLYGLHPANNERESERSYDDGMVRSIACACSRSGTSSAALPGRLRAGQRSNSTTMSPARPAMAATQAVARHAEERPRPGSRGPARFRLRPGRAARHLPAPSALLRDSRELTQCVHRTPGGDVTVSDRGRDVGGKGSVRHQACWYARRAASGRPASSIRAA